MADPGVPDTGGKLILYDVTAQARGLGFVGAVFAVSVGTLDAFGGLDGLPPTVEATVKLIREAREQQKDAPACRHLVDVTKQASAEVVRLTVLENAPGDDAHRQVALLCRGEELLADVKGMRVFSRERYVPRGASKA